MTENLRVIALQAAVTLAAANAEETVDIASRFLNFLTADSVPAANGGTQPAKTPRTPPATAPKAATAPQADQSTAPPAKAAPATPPAARKQAQGAPPATVAPPTTITQAAEALKALVQSKEPGRGREVAVALLEEFGVKQLSQIPPAKLAEFQRRCERAGQDGCPVEQAAEPGDDLLG